jgi:hypothetical protein
MSSAATRAIGILLCALAFSCAPAAAPGTYYPAGPGLLDDRPPQPPNSYRIVGWVLADDSGRPVADARVTVVGTTVSVLTDRHGRYLLDRVPEGHDEIIVAIVGYEREQRGFTRKRPMGLWIGPSPSFVDTLNFWLHRHSMPMP